jgi:putative aminopeptidase FrvX
MAYLEQLLMDLSNAFGPSGYEGEVRALFQKAVADTTEIAYDNLGSIMAHHKGGSETPRVLLAAHLDEVGLMVRAILPSGYLKVVPLGGWWIPALLAQRVLIRSRNGDHYGVVGSKPPHYMSEEEKNRPLKFGDLSIDTGAGNREEVVAMGIAVGDPVVPAVKAEFLSRPETLIGKAFDDRVGCAAVIQVLRELDGTHPNLVIGAGTVQEENGLKGARTVAALARPDVCIVLEGAPADDFPDAGGVIQGKLGGGPQLRYLDPSMIASRALIELAIREAENQQIPYQVAVREGGGTDGGEIQTKGVGGIPTMVIGVPVRYAHSHHGIVNLADLKATIQLVKGLVNQLDQAAVADIKRNPWK